MFAETSVLNLEGQRVPESLIQDFKTRLRGRLLRPGMDGYEDSRKIWNSNVVKRPSLIARCIGVADVVNSVNFARRNNVLVSIKGGGHSIAGLGLCDGGLTIDLTSLKGVSVDPVEKTARAGAGVTWGEFDHEAQLHGLATTGGEVSTTGISGLTLGGGIGWLLGKFGTSCDNLISADVVTADGDFLTANADQNKDLFWALRGGGGNFGVVTSLMYKLHPVGRVLGGFVAWPTAKTREVLEFLQDFAQELPDEVGKIGAEVITTRDGKPIVIIRPGYIGPIDEGERLLAPIRRRIAKPLYDNMRPMTYEALQTQRDAYWPWGRQNYFKSGFVDDLSDGFIETYRAHTENVPSPHSQIAVEYYHGAYCRARTDEVAYPHRQKAWSLAIGASWVDSSQSERNIRWARDFWREIEPLSGGVYVNFMSEGEDDRIRIAYGKNYPRLVSVKNKYDPTNLFRVNENVKPTVASS